MTFMHGGNPMRHLAACILAVPLLASAADRDAGLRAFAQIERVLLHPRCVNCHVPDGPLQRDPKRGHYPPAQRGVAAKGGPPLTSAARHSPQNPPAPPPPPGSH